MIVENEVVLSMELEEKLTDMGYFVVEKVASGEDAIAKADELSPDLVLMDIRLNGNLDGIEAARVIRDRLRAPVIYLTAYTDENTLQRAKLTEPFGYLVKPYSDRELFGTIEMALYKANMERLLRESEERFRTLVESAADMVFVKDGHLRYTHMNPAMLNLLGLSESDVIGKTDKELFGPDEAKQWGALERRVLSGQTVEVEHTLSIGGRTIACNCVRVPLRDASGDIYGLCGIGRDVTERWERDKMQDRPTHPGGLRHAPETHKSPAMQETMKRVRLATRTESICLFLGESGSGKDYLARYLHDLSRRASGPFFSINCAAVAPELAESELFGHERGAFTGAVGRKRGLLELAEGGTLLLNEVGDLSPPQQAKLLSFLDTKSLTRVGGEKCISVDARLVAATNRDLEQDVEAGRFRKDLFYRLNVITIPVPPLRERLEDFPALVEELIESIAKSIGMRTVPVVDSEALRLLSHRNWPGNIRELRNVLERALIVNNGGRLTAAHLGLEFASSDDDEQRDIRYEIHLPEGRALPEALREVKKYFVNESLRRSRGKVKEAARILGISRDSFNHLLKSLSISRR